MERQITLSEIATAAADALRNDMYHCYPGTVLTYDGGTETATVQVMTNDVRFDIDSGERISEAAPELPSVPVAWPRFGGFLIKGVLQKYDPVILFAWDLDPTPWRSAGLSLKPVDPGDTRRHGGGYWWALPTNLLVGHPHREPGGSLTIGIEGGQPLITINGNNIILGATGGDHVALASKVDAIMTDLKTLAAVLAGTVAIVGGSTGIPAPTLTTPAQKLHDDIASVASALIKAQ